MTIQAIVIPRPDSTYPLVFKPYKLDLSQFTEKVIDVADFEIENVSDQALDLSVIATESDYFDLDLPQSVPAGGTVSGKITLKESKYDQSFEKSFTVEVNDAGTSRFTVPVKRTVRIPNQAGTRVLPRGGK